MPVLYLLPFLNSPLKLIFDMRQTITMIILHLLLYTLEGVKKEQKHSYCFILRILPTHVNFSQLLTLHHILFYVRYANIACNKLEMDEMLSSVSTRSFLQFRNIKLQHCTNICLVLMCHMIPFTIFLTVS